MSKTQKYPEVITTEVLDGVSHVSDDQIMTDISETKQEIESLEAEIKGLKLIAQARSGTARGRLPSFLADAKQSGVEDRRDFVRFLQAVLFARKADK